jgi:hypothetical protein
MKKKLKLKRLTDGPDKGHVGAFDGDTLVNLIDPESLRQCFDECEQDGWPDPDLQPRAGSKTLRASTNKNGVGNQSLAKFLTEHFHLIEHMSDDLGLMILLRMREKSCNYAEALRAVTAVEPGAGLWRKHQNGRRG